MAWAGFLRGFEVAASGAVVLLPALLCQATALFYRQLLSSADRELHILLRQSLLLAVVGQGSGHLCTGSAETL